MPFITISSGLTLKVPTRGTTDWDTEFLNNFATPISTHQHTGAGDGLQLGGGSITDSSLDDRKLRLRTTEYFRSRNNAGSGDVNLIRANSADKVELSGEVLQDGQCSRFSVTFTNNQAAAANLGLSIDTAGGDQAVRLKYKIERVGTANLSELGILDVIYISDSSTFELIQEYSGQDAGLVFSVDGSGNIQYTSTDNAGSSSETMFVITERFGV